MDINTKTKIDRWKDKADLFLKKDVRCFIKTIDGGFYSADILSVGEDTILINDFIKLNKFKIYWLDIILFEEYKKEVNENVVK